MKSKETEIAQRYLLLFKLDAQRVFERIVTRKDEYLEVFASRRVRNHFDEIFKNRFDEAKIEHLAYCSSDTIGALDQFYELIDSTWWYLKVTQDMPGSVEEEIDRKIVRLRKLYETLMLFLNAELGVQSDIENMPAPSESDFVFGEPSFNEEPTHFDVEKEEN